MGTFLTDEEEEDMSSFVRLNVGWKRDNRERDEAAGANFFKRFLFIEQLPLLADMPTYWANEAAQFIISDHGTF